jgi:hypothetical protein
MTDLLTIEGGVWGRQFMSHPEFNMVAAMA